MRKVYGESIVRERNKRIAAELELERKRPKKKILTRKEEIALLKEKKRK